MMTPLFLLTLLLAVLHPALSTPTAARPRRTTKGLSTLHDCGVFIQRWWDSSFDIYIYNSSDTSQAFLNWDYIRTVESVPLSPPSQLPVTTMGSHQLVIENLANPVSNTDPGKLSFLWGTESWNSWLGTKCTVIPVGDWGAKFGYPTNTSCTFSCDA